MLDHLVETTVANVRKRFLEGDCPVTPAYSVEWLEDVVMALADKAKRAYRDGNAPDQEPYDIGKRDGFEEAVQAIDTLTGGDGEYRASSDPERHTPDPKTMIRRIVARFDALRSEREGGEPYAWTWQVPAGRVWVNRLGWAKQTGEYGEVRNVQPLYLRKAQGSDHV